MAKILLVQQEGDECLQLLRLLEGAGHAVEAASSHHTARMLFDTSRADVVITDLGLPNQDGLGFIQGLRCHYGDIQVIALCPAEGNGSSDVRTPTSTWARMSTAVGARRALTRPLDNSSLLAAVDALAPRGLAQGSQG
jgi:DNA-binding response OmpR family regulator